MYGLLGLLPTSGDNFMSTAPLEIYLLRKRVPCSILILPAVYMCDSYEYFFFSFESNTVFQCPPNMLPVYHGLFSSMGIILSSVFFSY